MRKSRMSALAKRTIKYRSHRGIAEATFAAGIERHKSANMTNKAGSFTKRGPGRYPLHGRRWLA